MSKQRRSSRQVQELDFEVSSQHPSFSKKSRKPQNTYENVFNFNSFVQQRKTVNLIPKSLKQEEYINRLSDPKKLIVFSVGPAGTGKTMLAVIAAIKALKENKVKKIIIARPAVGVDDEKHGFFPGTLLEKLMPWATPIMDVFKEYYSITELNRLIENEVVELAALSMLRGRTFKDAFIIIDEAQNTSVNSMKMVLTRLGEGSKMVVTGDLNQHDKPFTKDNGLKDFTQRLLSTESDSISVVNFTGKDIQRHQVVEEVLKIYQEI